MAERNLAAEMRKPILHGAADGGTVRVTVGTLRDWACQVEQMARALDAYRTDARLWERRYLAAINPHLHEDDVEARDA